MALIKCPECGKENVSSMAVACPSCGFGIKEFFNEKSEKEEKVRQIQVESELAKIRAKLDEFYIREGAYWYRESRDTYTFFNRNSYITDDEVIKCNNPGLGHYEFIKYLEKAVTEVYNECQGTTEGLRQYNEFVFGLFKILSFDKYNCFWCYGSKMDLYNTLNVKVLERETILEIAKQNALGNYTIWSAGELSVLFRGLDESDQSLCVSYFGKKYNPEVTNDVDIEGLYQKWLEYKNQDIEFDMNLIDSFKGKRSTIKMPSPAVANIYEEPKSYKPNNINEHIPKCPTCGSPNIKKISGLSKAGSVAMWGLFSRKVHKQWHCNNCGSEW